MSDMVIYRCEECGNIVALIKDGGGRLVCCGKPMVKLIANTTDASKEKHVPAVSKENGKVKVTIGSAPHPMLPEHYIEWIALVADGKMQFEFLKPGMEPEAEFGEAAAGTIYEHCNIHGLWKADF